jgi:hypothetical protein
MSADPVRTPAPYGAWGFSMRKQMTLAAKVAQASMITPSLS